MAEYFIKIIDKQKSHLLILVNMLMDLQMENPDSIARLPDDLNLTFNTLC